MAGAQSQRKPNFRRQAILIVLPVLVLATVGLMSLRQDKALAEHDAAERARVIANDLASRIPSLMASSDLPDQPTFSFQVNDAGYLVFPPPFDPVPTPRPFDVKELSANQARLWQKLRSADLGTQEPQPLVETVRELVQSNPPERFTAAALYDLGLLYARQSKLVEAVETFGLVAEKHPEAESESGLSFRTMAQFKLCELWPQPTTNYLFGKAEVSVDSERIGTAVPPRQVEYFVTLDAVCSNAIYHPTVLTPYLLARIHQRLVPPPDFKPFTNVTEQFVHMQRARGSSGQEWGTSEVQAEIQKWEGVWENHEASRELFSATRPYLTDWPRARLPVDGGRIEAARPYLSPIASNRPISAREFFWIESPEPVPHHVAHSVLPIGERRWLIARVASDGTNQTFRAVSERDIGAQVGALVRATKLMPEYFGVSVELAGRKLAGAGLDLGIWHYNQMVGSKGPAGMEKSGTGEVASVPLATAESEGRPPQLKVGVYLTSPTTFYRLQRTRAGWFSAVILISIASALIGLVTAWKAFARQQQLNEMKSNFVSSVSHELRAPIASVRLMAESLDRGKVQEPRKQGEYYRFIVEECRRLTSLIENVLDFSRIEQGRKQYEMEPTDLAALTRETVRLLEPYAAERQVRLSVRGARREVSEEVPGVRCQVSGVGREASTLSPDTSHLTPDTSASFELDVDGRAIQQALVNLIDNAVKHSPKGETVEVGLEVRGAGREVPGKGREASSPSPDTSHLTPDTSRPAPRTVHLYVEDHGPGIPAEEHEKIFERFYRLGSELRRETQGVGIGLSIVKHIVEAHGGRVLVRSAIGEGSRFTIELPVIRSESRTLKTE